MTTVKEDIVFGCRNLGVLESQIVKRLNSTLEELGLVDLKDRSTTELSAGEKQRLAIAGIYATGPNVFLFDESTTDLDMKGKCAFTEVLRNLKRKGYTIVVAEHDSEDLENLADKKIVMKNGRMCRDDENKRKSSIAPLIPRRKFSGGTVIRLKNVYFGLERYRGVHPHSLSRGERQRVAFISILTMQPEVIILDEPTTGLDENNWTRLMDVACRLNDCGKTVVFSTHNTKVIERYAQRIIKLEEGKIVRDEIRT
jgi:energy-coupling factor transporter ATP-binding protein EcfA2